MDKSPPPLAPSDTESFAYITFKDRLPVIITKIVDYVYRNKNVILAKYGDDKIDSVKYITSELARLRHELTTNKAITKFEGCLAGDEDWWNKAIIEERDRMIKSGATDDDEIYWFKTSFLFGENYMYRRIWNIIENCGIPTFDPFIFEKEDLFERSLLFVKFITKFLRDISSTLRDSSKSQLESYFEIFLKMSLWGNEADLSLSVSEENSKLKKQDPQIIVEENDSKLLVDDSKLIFNHLYDRSIYMQEEVTVTIILDNSGSELLTDLHLVDFLLTSGLATTVILYAKSLPWYVSDTTEADFERTLQKLSASEDDSHRWLAERTSSHLTDRRLYLQTHLFFTLPYPYCRMQALFPDLYSILSHSSLLIFKGDLNYRKLVSDLCWPHVATTFQQSLLGFSPAPLVALRVLKCDVQVGLTAEAYNRAVDEHPLNWMIKSHYGVVQSAGFDR